MAYYIHYLLEVRFRRALKLACKDIIAMENAGCVIPQSVTNYEERVNEKVKYYIKKAARRRENSVKELSRSGENNENS